MKRGNTKIVNHKSRVEKALAGMATLKRTIRATLILSIVLNLGLHELAFAAAPENLEEMFARKARRGTATWNASYFENPTTFIWQPETLMYRDVTTGHEVWKMTNKPTGSNGYFSSDIGQNAWSANGKYLRIQTTGRPTGAYNNLRDNVYQGQMISRVDGRAFRFLVNGPSRVARSGNGEFWSPQIPDTYYEFGNGWMGATGQGGVLYRVTVTDTGETKSPILTMPDPSWYWGYSKFMSADGRRIIAGIGEATLYPAIIYPDNNARLEDPDGYPSDRHLALYGGMNGGSLTSFHDQYMGGDGSWYFIMPNDPDSTANWWRIKTIGSASDGGALCDNSDFPVTDMNYDFGECWPENHGSVRAGNYSSPFVHVNPYNPNKTAYWSHFVPDRWGRHALFSNASDGLPNGYGPGIWDIANHRYVVPSFGGGAQHHDWHGFSDWNVSSDGYQWDTLEYLGQRVVSQKYNVPNSQIVVNSAYTRYDGGEGYGSLVRPSQSPDGTKVAWHSEFLDGRDQVNIFWSVVFYPFPPTNLEAVSSGGGVELRWLPQKYTERRWINPASGQIDEVGGEELFAREIKQYHVWRALSATGPWIEVGTGVPAEYGNDPVTNTLKPRSNGNWVSAGNKIRFTDNPENNTWFYAVTCEEWSGLETDGLGEVLQVTVSGGGVGGTNLTRYDFDLARKIDNRQKGFWTTSPRAPELTVSPGSAAGYDRLTWKETTDTKVRYYNIYYSNIGEPPATQAYRIASVPVGTVPLGQDVSYLDWLADPGTPGFYRLTSVDRYGNETQVVSAGPDQIISWPYVAQLHGSVTDKTLTPLWSVVSGPGEVTIESPTALETTASFSEPGTYILRLTASKDDTLLTDEVTIVVRPKPAENAVGISKNVIHPEHGSEAYINIELAEPCHVVMKIYGRDGLVKDLVNGDYPIGSHPVMWDGKNDAGTAVASGIYTVVVDLGGKKIKKKVAVVR